MLLLMVVLSFAGAAYLVWRGIACAFIDEFVPGVPERPQGWHGKEAFLPAMLLISLGLAVLPLGIGGVVSLVAGVDCLSGPVLVALVLGMAIPVGVGGRISILLWRRDRSYDSGLALGVFFSVLVVLMLVALLLRFLLKLADAGA